VERQHSLWETEAIPYDTQVAKVDHNLEINFFIERPEAEYNTSCGENGVEYV
jgi:hypothetical protein